MSTIINQMFEVIRINPSIEGDEGSFIYGKYRLNWIELFRFISRSAKMLNATSKIMTAANCGIILSGHFNAKKIQFFVIWRH